VLRPRQPGLSGADTERSRFRVGDGSSSASSGASSPCRRTSHNSARCLHTSSHPRHPVGLLRAYKPEGKALILAARVAGTANSAFPEGAPKPAKKEDEKAKIGRNLTTEVTGDESRDVRGDQSVTVGGDRSVEVQGSSSTNVAESWQLDLAGGAGVIVERSGRIVLTTGEASIVLDGPNSYIDARAMIQPGAIREPRGRRDPAGRPAERLLELATAAAPLVASAGALMSELVAEPEEESRAEQAFDDLLSRPLDPGAAPDAVAPPALSTSSSRRYAKIAGEGPDRRPEERPRGAWTPPRRRAERTSSPGREGARRDQRPHTKARRGREGEGRDRRTHRRGRGS
jgi:hypothetical protein